VLDIYIGKDSFSLITGWNESGEYAWETRSNISLERRAFSGLSVHDDREIFRWDSQYVELRIGWANKVA